MQNRMKSNDLVLEKESRYDFNATVSKLIELATSRNWGNPANHDLKQTLAKSGREVLPITVIEICKPAYSGEMLAKNDERIVSVMMPCRISVYNKIDGKTYLSYINMDALAHAMPPTAVDTMVNAANEIQEIIGEVV